MTITIYRTALCPRCKKAQTILQHIVSQEPNLDMNIVEVMAQPIKTFRAGVRMIPAIQCENEILSGIVLDEARIKKFLQCHLTNAENNQSLN